MREHLYRAKSIDTDEWVFGTYHYSADGKYHYILNREKLLYREPQEWALHSKEVNEVDPETVGAFTGLLDKNGKMIFEGDIVSSAYFSDCVVVMWCAGWHFEKDENTHHSFITASHTFEVTSTIHD